MNPIYKSLEFDIILEKMAALTPSACVADVIRKTEPSRDAAYVNKLLTQTGDALTVLASHRPIAAFDDISSIAEKATVGAVLQPADLLSVKNSIYALRLLKSCVESANDCDSLKDITAWVRSCDDLEREIDNAIESETVIKDSASDKLYSLRRSIARANAKLRERLDGFTRQNDISKYLQDNIVTLRGGRYVVPVRSECRSSVKGLVHDVSATGATVFIEPFAIVEANNEIITLQTEEQLEIERILSALSRAVAQNASALSEGQRVLIECGVIFAKAEYAKKTDSYRPKLCDSGNIDLKGARHPLIPPDSVVPVDITLDNKRVLLISGPNTGGKTVALKTVGLFSLMAASGMFLPTNDGSAVCVFDDIYCDIGDSQSIAQSLSTFSAHMTNISDITAKINDKSLVLLDEAGDGTDPDEGAALAVAIIKKILRSGATAVITTHFNAVKEFAVGCNDIANACMQFDAENFRPTYKLLHGASGSSYALEIAEKLGLDSQIIADARAALSEEKVAFDKILRDTELLRNAALNDRQECERLRAAANADAQTAQRLKTEFEKKLNDINENARTMVKRSADEYADYAQEIIDEMKEILKAADEAALFEARRTAKRLYDKVPDSVQKPVKATRHVEPSALTDGTKVYVSGLEKEGVIVGSLRGNKAIVAIGSIKTEMPISSLTVIEEKRTHTHASIARDTREPQNVEIMLLGKTVDEATEQIDRVLSDLPPHSTLRIVHGKGTGALGKGVQNYLRKQSKIKTFRYGRYGEGDTGVTIAELK